MPGPITVALLNRKGGCGKTSTCHHLAGTFAGDGRRVLLVDMDPQASLTQGFFGPQATEAMPRRRTVAALFDDACDPDPEDLHRPDPLRPDRPRCRGRTTWTITTCRGPRRPASGNWPCAGS